MAAWLRLNAAALALLALVATSTTGHTNNDTGPADEVNIAQGPAFDERLTLNFGAGLGLNPLKQGRANGLSDYLSSGGDLRNLAVSAVNGIYEVIGSFYGQCETHFPKDISKTRHFRQPCGVNDVDSCPCESPRYREFNGQCNNPKHNALGSSSTPYNRIIRVRGNAHGGSEGVKDLRSGSLPSARALSVDLFKDKDKPDILNSMLLMQWGQLVAHDVGERLDQINGDGSPIDCCDKNPDGGGGGKGEEGGKGGGQDHCLAIEIAKDDPFYSKFKRRCMNFVRSKTTVCKARKAGCGRENHDEEEEEQRSSSEQGSKETPRRQPANQLRGATSFLDLSFLYGSSEKVKRQLRLKSKGLLKSRVVDGKDHPSEEENPSSSSEEGHCSKEGRFSKEGQYKPEQGKDISSGRGKGEVKKQKRNSERGSTAPPGSKSANQLNRATSFLDLSFVYGNSKKVNQQLRLKSKGLLKSRVVDEKDHSSEEQHSSSSEEEHYSKEGPYSSKEGHYSSKEGHCSREEMGPREFLPAKTTNCESGNICYLSGDNRVDSQPWLATMQTVFLREHNRLATSLQEMHPDWKDETVFQETRRIMIAVYQHITYKYFLPKVVGRTILSRLKMDVDGSSRGKYDEGVNPSTLNEFSTGAFRYLHTLIGGSVGLAWEGKCPTEQKRLSDHFNDPSVLEEGYNLDAIGRGMTQQPSQKADPFFTEEITQHLFPDKDKGYGDDLLAIDIQRGRDHGLPSYNAMREVCGLTRAEGFYDFDDVMSDKSIRLLRKRYRSVEDVDFLVGGSFESTCKYGGLGESQALVGPTFGCVIGEQFFRWRKGDRYFFDLEEGPGKFTKEQYQAIRKVTLASFLCQNLQGTTSMQRDPFLQVSLTNDRRDCRKFPPLDLSPWEDYHPSQNCGV